eukprot:5160089-Pyramimonas_sp.AAC.1
MLVHPPCLAHHLWGPANPEFIASDMSSGTAFVALRVVTGMQLCEEVLVSESSVHIAVEAVS